MSSMMKCCVLTTALFLDGLAASASTTDIPNIEESDRRFAWLFLDEIPGSWGISPGSPSGGHSYQFWTNKASCHRVGSRESLSSTFIFEYPRLWLHRI